MTAPHEAWALYSTTPSFVLGFHGCDKKVGEQLLQGKTQHLRPSKNDYDWLGHGIYFWEDNPQRALEFAEENSNGSKTSRGKIKKPFVVGAVIDLRHCLNLIDSSALQQLADSYEILKATKAHIGATVPKNTKDLGGRFLDCAVIQTIHDFREDVGHPAYESVRGVFWEGEDIYPGAGFKQKNHIQICVRDLRCIKGYFRPITSP